MANYTDGLFRDVVSPDPREMPQTVAREVIQVATKSSALMQLAQRKVMPARTHRMPVLSTLPLAYWLDSGTTAGNDTLSKQTSKVQWDNVVLNAMEIAVLIPVSDAYVADTGVDLLNEMKPLIGQEFGNLIDGAGLFGAGIPSGWGTVNSSIYAKSVAAGNTVTEGAGADLAVDLGNAAAGLAKDGFDPNGWASEPGFHWRLINLRSSQGVPIYAPISGNQPETIFGQSLYQVKNGAWDSTKASVILGDWTKAIVGVRQDISFDVSDSGVIADPATGLVKFSAFQQDSKILRAVGRFAFATANPVTPLNTNASTRFPFAVLRHSGGPAS